MGKIFNSWNYEDDLVLLDESLTMKQKSEKLSNRGVGVAKRRYRLLVNKYNLNSKKLREEKEIIIDLYPDFSIADIGRYTNKSYSYVIQRIDELKKQGLFRDEKLLRYKNSKLPKHLIAAIKVMRPNNGGFKTKGEAGLDEDTLARLSIEEDKLRAKCGLGSKKLGFEIKVGKRYLIEVYSHNKDKKLTIDRSFECELLQATKDHFTFVGKNNVKESFLRKDILMREVRLKEVIE